jgi:MFS family permease
MAATFYQPAFAALTRWWGSDRVRALTVVTLAGSLASTVFAPLTATLAGHLSRRTTYAVLAGLLALVTVPPMPSRYEDLGRPHQRRPPNGPAAAAR